MTVPVGTAASWVFEAPVSDCRGRLDSVVSWWWLPQRCRMTPELQCSEVIFSPKVAGFRALLKTFHSAGFVFCDKHRMRGNSKTEALGYELAFLGMLVLMYLGSSAKLGVWSSACLCIPQLFDAVLLVGLCFTCRTKTGVRGCENLVVLTGLCL